MIMEDREAARAERQANLATLQQLTQMAMNHNTNGNGHGGGDNNGNGEPRSKLRSFQNTNPPTFTKAEEPLDADDWLRTMENNLEVAGVGEMRRFSTPPTTLREPQELGGIAPAPCKKMGM
jgi:hypothetical protein